MIKKGSGCSFVNQLFLSFGFSVRLSRQKMKRAWQGCLPLYLPLYLPTCGSMIPWNKHWQGGSLFQLGTSNIGVVDCPTRWSPFDIWICRSSIYISIPRWPRNIAQQCANIGGTRNPTYLLWIFCYCMCMMFFSLNSIGKSSNRNDKKYWK